MDSQTSHEQVCESPTSLKLSTDGRSTGRMKEYELDHQMLMASALALWLCQRSINENRCRGFEQPNRKPKEKGRPKQQRSYEYVNADWNVMATE